MWENLPTWLAVVLVTVPVAVSVVSLLLSVRATRQARRSADEARTANELTERAMAAADQRQRQVETRESESHTVTWTVDWLLRSKPTVPEDIIDLSLAFTNTGYDDAQQVRFVLYEGRTAVREFHFPEVMATGSVRGIPVSTERLKLSLDDPSTASMTKSLLLWQATRYLKTSCELVINWKTDAGVMHEERRHLPSARDYWLLSRPYVLGGKRAMARVVGLRKAILSP